MPKTNITEPNVLRLKFLGQPMATLAQAGDPPEFALAFEAEFIAAGHDLSPLRLPRESLSTRPTIYREGATPFPGGLPGLLADSLPDSWGRRLQRLAYPDLKTLLGRFAAIGTRGPGAITYEPVLDKDDKAESVDLSSMAAEAVRLAKTPEELTADKVDEILARGGSSLGGAQPKVTAHLPSGDSVLDLERVLIGGQPPAGCEAHILKFSALDDEGGGTVEYAFAVMAERAGINVARPRLIHDGARRHFACERFDRLRNSDGSVGKRHVHTLSGILHQRASDGGIDYEDFVRLSRRLVGINGSEECLRRAIFNLLATNRDDHGRNHAFIYDETTRTWALSPAYDLNPSVCHVLIALSWMHSMEIPKVYGALENLAEIGGIDASRARQIYNEVAAATREWPAIARESGVPDAMIGIWDKEIMGQTRALRASAAK